MKIESTDAKIQKDIESLESSVKDAESYFAELQESRDSERERLRELKAGIEAIAQTALAERKIPATDAEYAEVATIEARINAEYWDAVLTQSRDDLAQARADLAAFLRDHADELYEQYVGEATKLREDLNKKREAFQRSIATELKRQAELQQRAEILLSHYGLTSDDIHGGVLTESGEAKIAEANNPPPMPKNHTYAGLPVLASSIEDGVPEEALEIPASALIG